MEKKPFVTKEQLEEIAKTYPTPFYLYDEKGIRENAMKLKEAFSWNKGFREYFAVKATPNPFILKILQELGCGTDCSSKTELLMSDACGFSGHDIMFSSNDTPPEEFKLAYDLGAIINLDDFTHIECRLETGRTHQIRVHLASIGHPLLGDVVYGSKKPVPGLAGQCLHARRLRFTHPSTGQLVELECPLPGWFQDVLDRLSRLN